MIWEKPPTPQHIGLALAGGAVRGAAHIGVLQVLEEHGIRPDFIAGTSVGALVGGLYAAGVSPWRMAELVRTLKWRKISTVRLPSLKLHALSFTNFDVAALGMPMGLLDLDKLIDWIDEVVGGPIQFEALAIPFAAVASDINSGEMLVLNQGAIAPAIRASCSVPGVFTPVRRNGRLLVDGGVICNLPIPVAREMGAEYIIAVDLLPPTRAPTSNPLAQPSDSDGNPLSTTFLAQREPRHIVELSITALYSLIRASYGNVQADCLIQPVIGHVSFADISAADSLIAAGRSAAEAAIDQILAGIGRR